MKKYFIYREEHKGNIVYVNKIEGYLFEPKNTIDYGIEINKVIVVDQNLVKKIIKRKIKNKLEFYLQYLINKDDEDDSRRALDDLQRYRNMVSRRYSLYLENKYLDLLNKKFDVIERELKSNIIYNELEVEEIHKSR